MIRKTSLAVFVAVVTVAGLPATGAAQVVHTPDYVFPDLNSDFGEPDAQLWCGHRSVTSVL